MDRKFHFYETLSNHPTVLRGAVLLCIASITSLTAWSGAPLEVMQPIALESRRLAPPQTMPIQEALQGQTTTPAPNGQGAIRPISPGPKSDVFLPAISVILPGFGH